MEHLNAINNFIVPLMGSLIVTLLAALVFMSRKLLESMFKAINRFEELLRIHDRRITRLETRIEHMPLSSFRGHDNNIYQ